MTGARWSSRAVVGASLAAILGLLGCKRTSPEPPASPEPLVSEPVSSPAPSKPEGCDDPYDCMQEGTIAFLSGKPDVGLPMLDYACSEGQAGACENLSTALRSGSVTDNGERAHAAAARGCELGSVGACVDLGVDETFGLGGVAVDYAAALGHFTQGCEGGDPRGCHSVGVLHHQGKLGQPDSLAALPWFERGCEGGEAESCFNVGVLLAAGVSGDADLDGASKFMARSCELGDPDGCEAVEKLGEAIAAAASKVPGANVRIGTVTANGLTVDSLECRIEGGGLGLLGNMALLAALADHKAAIAKCGPADARAEVTWTAAGGKITEAAGEGSVGACVAKVLRKVSSPADGECAATIVLGP